MEKVPNLLSHKQLQNLSVILDVAVTTTKE